MAEQAGCMRHPTQGERMGATAAWGNGGRDDRGCLGMSWVVGLGALMGLGAWGRVCGMVFLLGVAGSCVVGLPWLGALDARYLSCGGNALLLCYACRTVTGGVRNVGVLFLRQWTSASAAQWCHSGSADVDALQHKQHD